MADEETTFGQALYDELKRLGGGVTSNLKYADIQRLKAADREAVVDLFRGSGYAVIQRIKEDTPEQVADYLTRQALQAQQTALIFAGMIWGFG